MNILHITYAYSPVVGGVASIIQYLSEKLVNLGHQVTVATQTEPHRNFAQLNGVQIVEFDIHGSELRGIRSAPGEIERYQKLLLNTDADLLMVFSGIGWPFDLMMPVLDQIPCATTYNPVGLQHSLKLTPYYERMGAALSHFDRILLHSSEGPDARFARRYGIDNFSVVHNGATLEEFGTPSSGFRQAYGIKTERMILDVAGYARLHKRQEYVLEAFFKARPKNTTMVFIGIAPSPQMRRYLLLLRLLGLLVQAKTGLGTVRFLEGVSRKHTVAAYFEADLFVHGAAWECAPVVVYEAMAAGTPWVCTDVGNVSELDGGVVCTFPDQMAEAIQALMANEDIQKKLGAQGRVAFENKYSVELWARKYQDIYRDVISQSRRHKVSPG
jgi:L-malate glycosyltransferase